MKGMRSFTYHGFDAQEYLRDMTWDEGDKTVPSRRWVPKWTGFHIYDDDGVQSIRRFDQTLGWLQSLRRCRPGLPPIEYLEYGGRNASCTLTGYVYSGPKPDSRESEVISTTHPMIKISTYNDDNVSRAPPCEVCGK